MDAFLQKTGHITVDNLMSLEAYSKYRKLHKAEYSKKKKFSLKLTPTRPWCPRVAIGRPPCCSSTLR